MFLFVQTYSFFVDASPTIQYNVINILNLLNFTILKLLNFFRHIVLCGCITYDSVSNFLDNFLHSDSQSNDTDVVIVDT